MKQRDTVRIIVDRDDGKVLVIEHGDDPKRIGLPGGGIESGETPAEAAARELFEETGIVAGELSPTLVLTDERGHTHLFHCLEPGPGSRIRASAEGSLRWADVAELTEGRHGAFYRRLFEALRTQVYAEDAEFIARAFHETYESLAPSHGYETRKSSRVPWEQVPDNNKTLMIATVQALLDAGVIEPG